MVLPAPPAAEGQAAQAWLTRIRGLLALGRAGTMILVRYGQPWSPWPVQTLIAEMGERVELLLDARRIVELAPEVIVVLLARRVDLDWLNVNRPHFAGRRVLVWVPGDAWLEYRQRAPDFFDWASHAVEAPPILPRFVAEGFEVARGWWPGIAWLGGAPLELILRLLADEGRWPMVGGREVAWVDANQSHEALADAFEANREKVIAVRGVTVLRHVVRVRKAMAGRDGLRVILDVPGTSTVGWFPLSCRQFAVDHWTDGKSEGEPQANPDANHELNDEQINAIAWLRAPQPILRKYHQHAKIAECRQKFAGQIPPAIGDLDESNIIDPQITRAFLEMKTDALSGEAADVAGWVHIDRESPTAPIVSELARFILVAIARRLSPAQALALQFPVPPPHTHAAAVERAMLHLHEGQIDAAMALLRPYLDEIREPPRAQQLWILALRMQGRALEANEQIERWAALGLDASLFELRITAQGTPREWLEHTMASDFDAVLAAALAPE